MGRYRGLGVLRLGRRKTSDAIAQDDTREIFFHFHRWVELKSVAVRHGHGAGLAGVGSGPAAASLCHYSGEVECGDVDLFLV